MLNEDERLRLQTIVDRGPDLTRWYDAAKADNDRWLDGINTPDTDLIRRQDEISEGDRDCNINDETAARLLGELADEYEKMTIEMKSLMREREAEVAQFE